MGGLRREARTKRVKEKKDVKVVVNMRERESKRLEKCQVMKNISG